MSEQTGLKPEATEVIAHAIDTFGTEEKAWMWLRKPNRALGERVPLDLLTTEIGVHEVRSILGRIDYGVYS